MKNCIACLAVLFFLLGFIPIRAHAENIQFYENIMESARDQLESMGKAVVLYNTNPLKGIIKPPIREFVRYELM